MNEPVNRSIVLFSRPVGEPKTENFRLIEGPPPSPAQGQFLVRNQFLSLDPYMRGRMSSARSYAVPVQEGEVMTGGTVGEVLETMHPGYNVGDIVCGYGGWQDYSLLDGVRCRKVDPQWPSSSTALGVLGLPGVTAYTGLLNIGQPKEGETLVVAAASGAVGSAVGQISKIHGARAVGIAGTREKCEFVTAELGFDACLNHRDPGWSEQLKTVCPDGIDIYFENVGGSVFQTVLPLLNEFARIPLCGLVSHYNDTTLPPGPNLTPMLMREVLVKRLTLRGFIVWDFAEQEEEALNHLARWIREGSLKYRENFIDGLENAPQAMIGLLKGENFGKLVVRIR